MTTNKKPRLKESDIRKQVQEYLRWQGWFVVYNLQGLGCYKGMPDLTAIKKVGDKSVVVQIEMKTPRGRQSEHQKKFQQEWEAHGGNYEVCRSLEDAMRIDKFYGKG